MQQNCRALFPSPLGGFFFTKNKITIINDYQEKEKEKEERGKRKKGKSKIL